MLLDDQPYDEKALDDESTCLALYDMVVAKTKEKAEEWNGTIDVTLIFVSHSRSSGLLEMVTHDYDLYGVTFIDRSLLRCTHSFLGPGNASSASQLEQFIQS